MLIEILDYLVFILGAIGAILIIYKDKKGFLCYIGHSICMAAVAITSGHIGIVLSCVFFIGIDVFGYFKWRKNEKEDTRL